MSRPDAAPASSLAALLSGDAFDGDDRQFALRLDALRLELAATTALESILVALIVEAADRLRRAHRMSDQIEAGDKNAQRYRNMAERSFWKALTSLQRGRRPAPRRAAEPPARPIIDESPAAPEPAPAPPVPPRPRVEREPTLPPPRTSPRVRASKADHLLRLLDCPRPTVASAQGCSIASRAGSQAVVVAPDPPASRPFLVERPT